MGKQMCYRKAERRRTPCEKFQDQLRPEFRDVPLITSVLPASYCHFRRELSCFPGKMSRRPCCWAVNHCVVPPSKLMGKQMCSEKAGRHCTTCKGFQDQIMCQYVADSRTKILRFVMFVLRAVKFSSHTNISAYSYACCPVIASDRKRFAGLGSPHNPSLHNNHVARATARYKQFLRCAMDANQAS